MAFSQLKAVLLPLQQVVVVAIVGSVAFHLGLDGRGVFCSRGRSRSRCFHVAPLGNDDMRKDLGT